MADKTCIALFDYKGEGKEQLSFSQGAVINLKKVPPGEGWAFGELNGRTGWLPVNYVAISNRARPAAAPPPVPSATTTPVPSVQTTQATVEGLPSSNVPASTSKAARPNDFWQQPFGAAGGGGGASVGGGG
ncbi:unnamed protein product, partial [Scytosiphon promiscuus]